MVIQLLLTLVLALYLFLFLILPWILGSSKWEDEEPHEYGKKHEDEKGLPLDNWANDYVDISHEQTEGYGSGNIYAPIHLLRIL